MGASLKKTMRYILTFLLLGFLSSSQAQHRWETTPADWETVQVFDTLMGYVSVLGEDGLPKEEYVQRVQLTELSYLHGDLKYVSDYFVHNRPISCDDYMDKKLILIVGAKICWEPIDPNLIVSEFKIE